MKLFDALTSIKTISILVLTTLLLNSPSFAQTSMRIEYESPATTKASGGDKTHTVKKGETLFIIARKHNVTVSDILAVNKVKGTTIYPGQQLTIQKQKVVAKNNAPASAYRTRGAESTPVMRTKSIASSQTVMREKPMHYTVKSGDDIYSISDTREVTVKQLKEWNPSASFKQGERVIVGKKYEEVPASLTAPATSARKVQSSNPQQQLGDLGSLQRKSQSSSVPTRRMDAPENNSLLKRVSRGDDAPLTYRTSSPAARTIQSPKAVSVTQGKFEMPKINNEGSVSTQLSYGELADPRIQSTRFYGHHKTLPIGTKVNLLIPENAGFVEIEIVGRLSPASGADIGLSPAAMDLVKGAGNPASVTITYN